MDYVIEFEGNEAAEPQEQQIAMLQGTQKALSPSLLSASLCTSVSLLSLTVFLLAAWPGRKWLVPPAPK